MPATAFTTLARSVGLLPPSSANTAAKTWSNEPTKLPFTMSDRTTRAVPAVSSTTASPLLEPPLPLVLPLPLPLGRHWSAKCACRPAQLPPLALASETDSSSSSLSSHAPTLLLRLLRAAFVWWAASSWA
jgi:hypothetical protein